MIETNVHELIDNMSDLAHFFYVYGSGKAQWAPRIGAVFITAFAMLVVVSPLMK